MLKLKHISQNQTSPGTEERKHKPQDRGIKEGRHPQPCMKAANVSPHRRQQTDGTKLLETGCSARLRGVQESGCSLQVRQQDSAAHVENQDAFLQ